MIDINTCDNIHLYNIAFSLLKKFANDEDIRCGAISSDVILSCGHPSNERSCWMLDLLKAKWKVSEFDASRWNHFFNMIINIHAKTCLNCSGFTGTVLNWLK